MSDAPDALSGSVAIVGFGDSYASRAEPKTPLQLAGEAVRDALSAAGLRKRDVTALLTGRSPMADPREQWNVILAANLGLTPSFTTQVMTHSSGVIGMLRQAMMALHTGLADHVLCVQADAAPLYVDSGASVISLDVDPLYEAPFGASPPAMYALLTRRYMARTGATEEDFARVAVAAQQWALDHPHAAKRNKGAITVDTVMDSRRIADPLKLWDCAVWGPGGTGGAFVVTRTERVDDHTDTPVHLLGAGTGLTHQYYGERVAQLVRTAEREPSAGHTAARAAYAMAGMSAADIDLVCPSTAFSSVGLMALEDLGFCAPGEAAALVRGGALDVGGALPFNTNGGWLSFGQPGTSCNMDSIVEALRQVTGTALGRQVESCQTALVHGIGGIYSCSDVAILSTRQGAHARPGRPVSSP